MSIKQIVVSDIIKQFQNAKNIEGILCLSVLIATKKLHRDATTQESDDYFRSIGDDCGACPLVDVCLACIINE